MYEIDERNCCFLVDGFLGPFIVPPQNRRKPKKINTGIDQVFAGVMSISPVSVRYIITLKLYGPDRFKII